MSHRGRDRAGSRGPRRGAGRAGTEDAGAGRVSISVTKSVNLELYSYAMPPRELGS